MSACSPQAASRSPPAPAQPPRPRDRPGQPPRRRRALLRRASVGRRGHIVACRPELIDRAGSTTSGRPGVPGPGRLPVDRRRAARTALAQLCLLPAQARRGDHRRGRALAGHPRSKQHAGSLWTGGRVRHLRQRRDRCPRPDRIRGRQRGGPPRWWTPASRGAGAPGPGRAGPGPGLAVALGERTTTSVCRWPRIDWRIDATEPRLPSGHPKNCSTPVCGAPGSATSSACWAPRIRRSCSRATTTAFGATRMHPDPQRGVVDADLKIYGVRNVFLARPFGLPDLRMLEPDPHDRRVGPAVGRPPRQATLWRRRFAGPDGRPAGRLGLRKAAPTAGWAWRCSP